MSDFIQQEVNRANEESLDRFRKRLQRKMERARCIHNRLQKKHKLERQNKRKGRK